jgi:hypothetical protein
MNKFEKLIEYIINDEDQKARELFHDIVVEKSRDIYESIIEDEESVEEQVAGDQVGQMVDEIGAEESVHEEEDEFSIDDVDADDEVSGDLPMDGDHGIEGDDMGAEPNHDETVMNIDAKLDELLAKFDEIMGDTGGDDMGADMGDEMPAEEPGMDDMDGDEQSMDQGEEQFAEGKKPDFLDLDKDGNKKESMKKAADDKKSGSGASGSGKSGSGTSGKPFESRKQSTTELMREYVDKIQDMNLTGASEGDAVGATGKKTSVNDKSITGPGADFGGKTATPRGGEQNQDGTSAPSSPKPGQLKSGNVNVPGGNAGKSSFKTKEGDYSTERSKEGQTTDGSVPVAKKSVQVQNTGKK